jgi:hypothetical protein
MKAAVPIIAGVTLIVACVAYSVHLFQRYHPLKEAGDEQMQRLDPVEDSSLYSAARDAIYWRALELRVATGEWPSTAQALFSVGPIVISYPISTGYRRSCRIDKKFCTGFSCALHAADVEYRFEWRGTEFVVAPRLTAPNALESKELEARNRLGGATAQIRRSCEDLVAVASSLAWYSKWNPDGRIRRFDSRSNWSWLADWEEHLRHRRSPWAARIPRAPWHCSTTPEALAKPYFDLDRDALVLIASGLGGVSGIDADGNIVWQQEQAK